MALEHAREQGFKQCYLETTAFLTEAIRLYEHLGFEHISEALGCTGHVDCEVRMLKPSDLTPRGFNRVTASRLRASVE